MLVLVCVLVFLVHSAGDGTQTSHALAMVLLATAIVGLVWMQPLQWFAVKSSAFKPAPALSLRVLIQLPPPSTVR